MHVGSNESRVNQLVLNYSGQLTKAVSPSAVVCLAARSISQFYTAINVYARGHELLVSTPRPLSFELVN